MLEAKNLGGRPEIVLTPEEIAEVEELAAELTTEQIGDHFGFCRETFRQIRERQPEVSRHYKKGRTKKIRKYIKHLDQKIFENNIPGDVTALIFALKAFGGLSEKQTIETKDTTQSKQLPQINISFNDKPEH